MFEIREEQDGDAAGIRDVHRAAFGGTAEAVLVDRLRDARLVLVSLVAVEHGRIVGHVLFSELPVEGAARTVRAASLAPVAVLPDCQRRGIGSALIREGLAACAARGCEAVIVVGEPAYYERFGFSARRAHHLASPYAGEFCMALALTPGALDCGAGKILYSAPFHDLA